MGAQFAMAAMTYWRPGVLVTISDGRVYSSQSSKHSVATSHFQGFRIVIDCSFGSKEVVHCLKPANCFFHLSRPASCTVFCTGDSKYSSTVRLPRLTSAVTCIPG